MRYSGAALRSLLNMHRIRLNLGLGLGLAVGFSRVSAHTSRSRRTGRMGTAAGLLAVAVCVGCSARADTRSPEPVIATVTATPVATEPANAPAPAPQPTTTAQPAPEPKLTTEQRLAIFHGSQEDAATDRFLGTTKELEGKHYLACNEKTLQIFEPHFRNLGGGYIGVGSDQAYLFIGWMRPEFAWLIDYDPSVVAIHQVYRAFFDTAENPDEFLTLWTKDGRTAGKQAIASHVDDPAETKKLQKLYLVNRGWIHRRLQAVRKRMTNDEVDTYLNDPETYQYVRTFLAERRARPMLSNLLTADGGLQGIAEAARTLEVPVRLLYLSNAEQYWDRYSDAFRQNVAILPFDDRSLVARTLLTWAKNQDYIYNLQAASNFVQWLEHPAIVNVTDVAHGRPKTVDPEIINHFEVTTLPEDSPAARRAEEAAQAERDK